jgi:hypothetical protein
MRLPLGSSLLRKPVGVLLMNINSFIFLSRVVVKGKEETAKGLTVITLEMDLPPATSTAFLMVKSFR